MKIFALMLGSAAALIPMAAQAERGADGPLRILYWQGASTMNPYLSGIAKEVEAASLVLEPLARFDENGGLVAVLAEEIPSSGPSTMIIFPSLLPTVKTPDCSCCRGTSLYPSRSI